MSPSAGLHHRITSQDQTSVAQWLVDMLVADATTDTEIDARWRERRQRHLNDGRLLKDGHREHFTSMIAERSAGLAAMPTRELLDALAGDFGVNWVDISRLLHVSVPTLRKWRRDENGASGDNHLKLARLVGFMRAFREIGAGEPAQWLNVPFDPDYTVRPRDIYSAEVAPALLDYAASGGDFREILDQVDSEWRNKWARAFTTVEIDHEGTTALVSRGSTDSSGR